MNNLQFQNMKRIFLVLFAITLMVKAQKTVTPANLPNGSVRLLSSIGQYLKVCQNCGQGAQPYSASIQPLTEDCYFVWTLENLGGGKVAFKGSNGLYLSRCAYCWKGAAYPESAFVHVPIPNVTFSQWTPVAQPNGLYSFLSDNGKYLSLCTQCTPSPVSKNFAFIHEADSSKSHAQWNVQYTSLPKLGTVQLKTDTGYVKICTTCGVANSVSIQPTNDGLSKWKIVSVGNKVAFQGSNGKYLSVCDWCLPLSYYQYSSSCNSSVISQFASFTPIKLPNGKWSFRGYQNLYMARCNSCAAVPLANMLFVHGLENTYPFEQFDLIYS